MQQQQQIRQQQYQRQQQQIQQQQQNGEIQIIAGKTVKIIIVCKGEVVNQGLITC